MLRKRQIRLSNSLDLTSRSEMIWALTSTGISALIGPCCRSVSIIVLILAWRCLLATLQMLVYSCGLAWSLCFLSRNVAHVEEDIVILLLSLRLFDLNSLVQLWSRTCQTWAVRRLTCPWLIVCCRTSRHLPLRFLIFQCLPLPLKTTLLNVWFQKYIFQQDILLICELLVIVTYIDICVHLFALNHGHVKGLIIFCSHYVGR